MGRAVVKIGLDKCFGNGLAMPDSPREKSESPSHRA